MPWLEEGRRVSSTMPTGGHLASTPTDLGGGGSLTCDPPGVFSHIFNIL